MAIWAGRSLFTAGCRVEGGPLSNWSNSQVHKVCPVSGSRRLIEHLGSTDKQLLLYPGLLHEPHNEAAAAQATMFRDMSDWMLKRTGRSERDELRIPP